jgi:hypothetical protein
MSNARQGVNGDHVDKVVKAGGENSRFSGIGWLPSVAGAKVMFT